MPLCIYALTAQMITDGPTVGILPLSFLFFFHQWNDIRVMLLANISSDNVVFASGGCCVLVNRLLSSPPTWTTIPVPTVSQGLVGKQQWKSCNYSPNIPGQKHIIPSLEQWNAERAELSSLLSLMWGLEGSAHNVWFGLILPRPSSPFPRLLGFFSPLFSL